MKCLIITSTVVVCEMTDHYLNCVSEMVDHYLKCGSEMDDHYLN